MVYRIYTEKKEGLAHEASALKSDLTVFLGMTALSEVRVLNRYDVENITADLFAYACTTVFSEPQLDTVSTELDTEGYHVFAVEYLPGQYDQRADSAAQCIQIISCTDRPTVRTAKVYLLKGDLSEEDLNKIKKYVINPVESREASPDKPETLATEFTVPTEVAVLDGFIDLDEQGLAAFLKEYGLAMDEADLKFCQDYFVKEGRNPTVTEIRMLDTYWSDHCRHTTFTTTIDSVTTEDRLLSEAYAEYIRIRKELGVTKPINLMNIATLATKYLKTAGKLTKLDESEEINACTVKIKVRTEAGEEDWLLLFKNETHNHPTEIEPFGGAATCIGGAIRDPLSGRSYVYGAMRLTGGADPLRSLEETLPGKLPQKKLVTTAAAGYSSYGNQIGLATGQVDELYHDGYAAKHMEIGAVIAAAPAENVRRECPTPGDAVILLGGRTGRDGCGGATGSSKSHTLTSLETCGAEVQKGNAPEERKLQRLFRNPEVSRLIKRCNDFGAGGVSVAIGELADGLDVDLNKVPKKYEGLDGTELAISESQERMAVVVEAKDVARFCELADSENLEATVVAKVKEDPRLTMTWNGKVIVDIARDFLNSAGAEKHIDITPAAPKEYARVIGNEKSFTEAYREMASDLNVCSKRGLGERFDSTIGANTVMMPFGGKYQLTPSQAMVMKIPTERAHTDTCSYMAWGCNPMILEKSPYHGAYLAVVESVSKLIASGASYEDVYLTFQEYFEKPLHDGERWGKPLSALLGAFRAQLDLGIAAIGGKDSMSGSFEKLDVPPTLASFAVTTGDAKEVVTGDFKAAGHTVRLLVPPCDDESGLPLASELIALYNRVHALMQAGKVYAAWTPGFGGVAEGVMKMALGNKIGFAYNEAIDTGAIFDYCYGAFILETADDVTDGILLGSTTEEASICKGGESIAIDELLSLYEGKLEPVYKCNIAQSGKVETFTYEGGVVAAPAVRCVKPRVIIPVFPGTNCEYDTAKVMADAGAEPQIMVINNLTTEGISRSVETVAKAISDAQMIFIPGGFSGGDEPDGSGKFITAFFRSGAVRDAVTDLLDNRGGLIAGICNGFQALIKLGLVPYGKIIDTDASCPTLTFNTIARHQSRIVRTRIASVKSPWLGNRKVGDIVSVPISHGEGRFLCEEALLRELAANGQIATQYVDFEGLATTDVAFNPNNSVFAVEGITSPDGRVIGKMGHSERIGSGLYANVPGDYDMGMFDAAVKFFKG